MKVVQINAVCGSGSTGKICVEISKTLSEKGIENYILYSSGCSDYPLAKKISGNFYIKIQALKSKAFGNYGFNSILATKRMIRELERIKPTIVHLHNLHGHDCNLDVLISYLKMKKIKVIWTFHDCWAFTGYCTHFILAKCDKWKVGCKNCPQRKQYSWLFDKSEIMYKKKKSLFSGLDLTIVTPSEWLGNVVKESFLRDFPIKVIHNGIDLNIFKPTENDFRKRFNLNGKKIVLGVSSIWNYSKGLDVFISLAKMLDENYQIVLVGTNNKIDKKLPNNIISIHRTQNQIELAQIYTAADVFVNPTREDTFPTVNIEALACGTPIISFDTGGNAEIFDNSCGVKLEVNNTKKLYECILKISSNKQNEIDCINRAKKFNKNSKFKEYVNLYRRVL